MSLITPKLLPGASLEQIFKSLSDRLLKRSGLESLSSRGAAHINLHRFGIMRQICFVSWTETETETPWMSATEYVTTRRGKWRRWLAIVYLNPFKSSLNTNLIAFGSADLYRPRRTPRKTPRVPQDASIALRFAPAVYRSLSERARSMDLKPAELIHNVVRKYLD